MKPYRILLPAHLSCFLLLFFSAVSDFAKFFFRFVPFDTGYDPSSRTIPVLDKDFNRGISGLLDSSMKYVNVR